MLTEHYWKIDGTSRDDAGVVGSCQHEKKKR